MMDSQSVIEVEPPQLIAETEGVRPMGIPDGMVPTGPVKKASAKGPKTPSKLPQSFYMEVTWGKILFACGVLVAIFVLLTATLFAAVWLGHGLRGKRELPDAVPKVVMKTEKTKGAAQAAPFLVPDLSALKDQIASLEKALTTHSEEGVAYSEEVTCIKGELINLKKAIGKSKMDPKELRVIIDDRMQIVSKTLLGNMKKAEDNRARVFEQTIKDSINEKITQLKSNTAINEEQAKTIISDIKGLKSRFVRMTALYRLVYRWGMILPDPKGLPRKLTDGEKIMQLNDFAEAFVLEYEKTGAPEKKKWNDAWDTAITDGGMPNSIANNKLMSVLASLRGKNKEQIDGKDTYNACRLFLAYRDQKLQFPKMFMDTVIRNKDPKDYMGILKFIQEEIDKVR